MKKVQVFVYPLFLLFLFSCKSNNTAKEQTQSVKTDTSKSTPEKPSFFPVTNYIQGQIFEISNGGLNPFKFVTSGGHTDSAWLKMEDLKNEVADFLTPVIDSLNLVSLFSETKFMDETLDAITLTYDPVKELPDSFSLRHWDVYIDPNSGSVKKVYILKKLPAKKIQQLTWIAKEKCNIKTISEDVNGKPVVDKEVTIKWTTKE